MTPGQLIDLLEKSGMLKEESPGVLGWQPNTQRAERFAALVAAAEREACAELVWPTQQVKTWSDEELTAMTGAFNRAQEKHGWYETIMAVGASALKHRAAAIRARGQA